MANRDAPNTYFAWYNDDDRLAIVVQQASSSSDDGTTAGEYDTYLDSTVTNGVKITIHSKYEAVSAIGDDLETTCGLDESMHSYVLDYVKARILEDIGQVEPSKYFREKYEVGVEKKATRKSGVRVLLVPPL
jgi:hypothetical protein